MKKWRSDAASLFARIAPYAVPILYGVMLLLVLIFFTGHGEFIYEG